MSINWNNIRPLNNSQNDGFEELVCQLARNEDVPDKSRFTRKGRPDAGVECYWTLNNTDEWGWQAKFFNNSITSTQWNEIDESVKTTLDKHPNLKKYYIAVPNNPPDARVEGQASMLDKWNERVSKWGSWASEKGLNVEFIPWWSSDLINRLRKPENVGLTYFWFNKEEFTDQWCKEQSELSIADLGKRYTPELNVELEVSKIFNGLSRDKKFKLEAQNLFDSLLITGKKVIPKLEELKDVSIKIQEQLAAIHEIFTQTEFQGVETIPTNRINCILKTINKLCDVIKEHYLETDRNLQPKTEGNRYYQKFGDELRHLRDFDKSVNLFREFIEGLTTSLANMPFLLLAGEAGIGKSHMLADIVRQRNTNNLISLFFLGQHFVTEEDPWTQIFKKNNIKCTVDEFLGAINSKAQILDSRALFFIDAANEGRGKYFWEKNIKSFILKIKKFKWLGLVLSIRSSYSDLIFPKNTVSENDIIRYTHYGFRNTEYEATKLFFTNYGIELPSIPLLHPEFQNPLFLKLFCEGLNKAGYTKIPDGFQGITSIINFFIASVNTTLSKPNRLDFSNSLNIVKKVIDNLISFKIEHKLKHITYEQAFILINKISKDFSIKSGLLEELISEGVFFTNLSLIDNQYEEIIYLTYERFEDHLTANYLTSDGSDLERTFKDGGKLFYLVKDEHACHINKGLIEALTIQVPEKTGKEFYELAPQVKDYYPIIECFVQSLLWRKTETISEKLLGYINSTVFSYQGTHDLFWDTIISVTSIPDHYFNANSLHKNLMNSSLADRDAWWTMYLKDQFYDGSPVKRLIDWSWSITDKSHVSDESLKLSTITIAWLHTSTNRQLRDSATKALVSLLENRIPVLIQLLKQFENVNDPYVYERLFAVAYGCALRTSQKELLLDLSRYIFKTIFDVDGDIYPHILLRDYARGVIEYTAYLGYKFDFEISRARPPYNSSLPNQFPSDKEIDTKYRLDYEGKDFKDYYWSQNHILSSMTTEYGRGTGHYGDFGRYVFQSALKAWNVNENELSNLAIEWIFNKYGYDINKHAEFDRNIGSGRGRNSYPHERIGKKYQWLAFYELLARVSDNCTKYLEWSLQDKEIESFEGPWAPYVRDIDPTLTIRKTGHFKEEDPGDFWWCRETYKNWDLNIRTWIETVNDLPDIKKILNPVNEANEEWLILECDPVWIESKVIGDEEWDYPHKRLWYHLRSCLVTGDEYEILKNWVFEQNSTTGWMPESPDRYEVFSREYYWSPAYQHFNKEYYEGVEKRSVHDHKTGKIISNVILTTNNFLWEEEFDNSKEGAISFLKPSNYIYQYMNLSQSKREGEFIDKDGDLICFDPSVYYDSWSYLLIKKKPLLSFLQKHNLKILWTVFGEKNILGDYSNGNESKGRLEIRGFFYLTTKGTIDGKINTKTTS